MNLCVRIGLVSAVALLAGCGGGGGSSANSGIGVVAGSPTPTPSTPTPSPAATTFSAFSTALTLTVSGSTTTLEGGSTSARSIGGVATFSFMSDTSGRYTVQNELRSQTFGPSISKQTSVPDYFPRTEYQTSSSGTTDYLVLFKQANASPAIPTNYASYGAWQHNVGVASGTNVRLDYFAYGTPTPVSAIPRTGTATYRWAGTGNFADNTRLYFTQTYNVMTVDFATGRVTTNISLTGSDFLSGGFGGLLGMTFNGQIVGNTADGPLTFTDATYSGTGRVVFFGPNAENIGIVYSGQSSYTGAFSGAGVGVTP